MKSADMMGQLNRLILALGLYALPSFAATTFHLSDAPYQDYFYSDNHSAAQVVITSPLPDSNLTLIGPRLLVGWPAGNSGAVAFFAPKNGKNGTLSLSLVQPTDNAFPLAPVYQKNSSGGNPINGVAGVIRLNSSAVLSLPILGSVRTIRDFTEGPSILVPEIQNAIKLSISKQGVASLSRLWLDNVTTTTFTFQPINTTSKAITISKKKLQFPAGEYRFTATFNYPQLTQLSASSLLNPASQGLIAQQPVHTKSVSFLSYTEKLLAGGWRFLTYFGRDTMITLLLMQPVLSEGNGGAIEAVIGAVLERINKTSGAVCHEETIGDYATYLNQINYNISSTKSSCSYIMIDSDYYLPIVMKNYFVDTTTGKQRQKAFFARKAPSGFGNKGLSYTYLAQKNAERIVNHAAAFAKSGGQNKQHLRHLEPDQIVGQWRDSTYGIGGGRIPFDVNTALVPAALRALAALSKAGFFPDHPHWADLLPGYAKIWEDKTLEFFQVSVPPKTARSRVTTYIKRSGFKGPSNIDLIPANGPDVTYHALALNGNNNQTQVEVLNTDVCFRLYLLNTTQQTQLTSLLNQTATQIQQPFPIGLSTSIGMLVANPAYGGSPVYAANWTTAAYHGTVVWSWQLAMMAAGLGRQLDRCRAGGDHPDFCSQKAVYANVKGAYNHLWNIIDKNRAVLTNEVWSWRYINGGYKFTPLGDFSPTESDAAQLWSLTFLAVTRDKSLS